MSSRMLFTMPASGFCEHCEMDYRATYKDGLLAIRHPTLKDMEPCSEGWAEKLRTCPNAGKRFVFSELEEG